MGRWCLCLLSIFVTTGTSVAEPATAVGDLYVLGIALNQVGARGAWAQVGPAGGWKSMRAGAVERGKIYTAGADGRLHVTDPTTGKRSTIGPPDFGKTNFAFTAGDRLLTLDSDGSLFRVDPTTGSRDRLGPVGAWKEVRAGVVLDGSLYTTEADTTLWVTDVSTGFRKSVGGRDLADTVFLLTVGHRLYGIQRSGDLFQIECGTGSRMQVGPTKAWKACRAAAVLDGKLCSAERDGTLQTADPTTGQKTRVGKPEFGGTVLMLPVGDALYTIETNGSLYRVCVAPSDRVNDNNCFPDEVEKVFRDQGRAFYRDLYCQKILGAQATRSEILAGLNWLGKSVRTSDRVVLYLTCHGGTDSKKGWGIATADGLALNAGDFKRELGRLPCPVIAVIETCGCGGFARAHEQDPPVPANVTALCACAENQSTDNHLDVALAEALYGRADFNHDGTVDLDEVLRYIELRYREWWPDSRRPEEGETPVLVKAKTVRGPLALTRTSARLAAVVHDGALWSALLEEKEGDQFRVHFLGWNSKPGPYFLPNSIVRDRLCLPDDGPPLVVEQKGAWYPARLVRRLGEKSLVHYLGYNEEELVTEERIRHPFVGRPGEVPPASHPGPGTWEQVGAAHGWLGILAGVVVGDQLYTAETDDRLVVTNLRTGSRKAVGNPHFGATAWMFQHEKMLYTIETDGSLYRVNPGDGQWTQVGKRGNWKQLVAGAVRKGRLYTVAASGVLTVADLSTGRPTPVGKAIFAHTAFLFANDDALYSIGSDGDLQRIEPDTGRREPLGHGAHWKGVRAGAIMGHHLYTAESDGGLWETDIRTGVRSRLGKPDFAATTFMAGASERLFTIEKDGTLYKVTVR